jgi:hypothetical protein
MNKRYFHFFRKIVQINSNIRSKWFAKNVDYSLRINFLGEKKLEKVICPDVKKSSDKLIGATMEGPKKLGGNALIEKKRYKYSSWSPLKF